MRLELLILVGAAAGELANCVEGLLRVSTHMLTLFPSNRYEEMALYSGKWVNDLGDYESCEKVPGAKYALIFLNYAGPPVGVGMCGPETCTQEDYFHVIGNLTASIPQAHPLSLFLSAAQALPARPLSSRALGSPLPLQIAFPSALEPSELSTGASWMLFVCGVLLLCAAVGTFLHVFQPSGRPSKRDPGAYEMMVYKGKQEESEALPMSNTEPVHPNLLVRGLLCFSLISNFNALFRRTRRRDALDALDGVRVISLLFIILGHLLMIRVLASVTKNLLAFSDYFKSARATPILSAHFAVDTFFWLSGFLLAYVLLQKSEPRSARSVLHIYLHRFLRLCPTYLFVLFLTWTLSIYIPSGPRAYGIDVVNEHCAKYWWTSVFFINNQVPDWLGIGCLGQSWYLGTDMQLFWALVPVIYLYRRQQRWGWYSLAAICSFSVISSAYVTWEYSFSVLMKSQHNFENHYSSRYYVQPYTRSAPYVLGIVCAICYYTHCIYKANRDVYDSRALGIVQLFENRIIRLLCLVLSCVLGLFLVFIQNDAYQAVDDERLEWSRFSNTVFIGTCRFLWGMCVSLFLMPLLQGFSPICSSVLSLDIWAPLSKLTFCAYLIHVHLLAIVAVSQKATAWFGDLSLYSDFCFVTVLSYAVSVPLALFVEMPLTNLAKAMGA